MTEIDRERKRREQAYKIWEDEGRPDGEHDAHWNRADRPDDLSAQQSEDITKVNQEADDKFAKNGGGSESPADIRPPSSVAPD